METSTITIELPAQLYTQLQTLAEEEQSNPIDVLARLITLATQKHRQPTTQAFREILKLAIDMDIENFQDDRSTLIHKLITAGLMHPRPITPVPPPPISDEERQALADLMGQAPGKPLSQVIIEERGEW